MPGRYGWLLIAALCCGPATAAVVTIEGSATLSADANSLRGELTLTPRGSEAVAAARIFSVETAGRTVIAGATRLTPDQTLHLPIRLDRAHAVAGRYHLMVEVAFEDRSGTALGLYFSFPYFFQRQGAQPAGPMLAIDADRLEWEPAGPGVREIRTLLTTGPHWRLTQPVEPGVRGFDLEQTAQALPDFTYAQLARLDWIGSDGFHYSRVIPWAIATDGSGHWIRSSGPLAGQPGLVILLASGLALLLAGLGLAALRNREASRDGPMALFGVGMLGLLTLWLASFTHPELWLTSTWATGGDTASHVLYASKFRDWLFDGQITGWMPEVFAGFPAFRYYFPLPFTLMALLSLVMPLQVAFKIVAMAPALLLPAAAYWTGGRFGWPQGARLFAALFATGFLVHQASSIWGGNLLSQLSGEFCYSWGLLLTLLFWGSLTKALRAGGRAWITPALLEALVGLSHGYPLLVAGFGALLLPLFRAPKLAALVTVLKVHAAAFLLLGFWLLPLLENLPYTVPNDTSTWIYDLNLLLPPTMAPLLLLGLPALVIVLRNGSENAAGIRFMLLVAALAGVGLAGAYQAGLADVRFFPFAQLAASIALV